MKRWISILTGSLLLAGCSHEPSLQKYFLAKSGQKNFMVLDLSSSLIDTDKAKLTPNEAKVLKSFEKLNVLLYQTDSVAPQDFNKENQSVKQLLKDKKYQELMHFGSAGMGGSLSFVGNDDKHIDEFVIYLGRKENGFAVVRVLGDDMDPSRALDLMSLLQKSKPDMGQLAPLTNLMQPKKPKNKANQKPDVNQPKAP